MTAPDEIRNDLLLQVRDGDLESWNQLVSQFHGRLLAFARKKLDQAADADDVVQETFLSFLNSLATYREDASLETWLFQILRRRIADHFRRKGRTVEADAVVASGDLTSSAGPAATRTPVDQSASWYVRREEQRTLDLQSLARAVAEVTAALKERNRFRDLIVFDLLFFAGRRNLEIAEHTGLQETAVALLKHRFIQRVASATTADSTEASSNDSLPDDEVLAEVWESRRPTCPKRTTLGKYLMGTLDEEWDGYVSFHVEQLPCPFCSASLDDLSEQFQNAPKDDAVRDRIMESTVGFFPGAIT